MSNEEQQEQIEFLAKHWMMNLGMHTWKIQHIFYDKDNDNFHTVFDRDGNMEALFLVQADWRYMNAVVHVNLPLVAKMEYQDVEENYVHEMMHMILNEVVDCKKDARRDHEERVATMLACAFCNVKYNQEEIVNERPDDGPVEEEILSAGGDNVG